MSLLIAFAAGVALGFAFSGKFYDTLTTRKRLAYKTVLAELQEAKELHAASILRHVIASEMQAEHQNGI